MKKFMIKKITGFDDFGLGLKGLLNSNNVFSEIKKKFKNVILIHQPFPKNEGFKKFILFF